MESIPNKQPESRETRRWLIPVVVVSLLAIGLFTVFAALAGSSGHDGYGWMMGGGAGWGWMWGVGALMMTVPLILFFVLLLALVPPNHAHAAPPAQPPSDDLATVVRVRYARGELTSEQYRRILDDLQTSG